MHQFQTAATVTVRTYVQFVPSDGIYESEAHTREVDQPDPHSDVRFAPDDSVEFFYFVNRIVTVDIDGTELSLCSDPMESAERRRFFIDAALFDGVFDEFVADTTPDERRFIISLMRETGALQVVRLKDGSLRTFDSGLNHVVRSQ